MDHRRLFRFLHHRFNGRTFLLSDLSLEELDQLYWELDQFRIYVEEYKIKKRIKESKKKMDYEESEE